MCRLICSQKTHTDIANEKQLHLVEMRDENGGYPKIVASPAKCRTEDEITKDEVLDYQEFLSNGRVKLQKRKFAPWYTKLDSWQYHLKKTERFRNHEEVRIRLVAEHGETTSFLNEQSKREKSAE